MFYMCMCAQNQGLCLHQMLRINTESKHNNLIQLVLIIWFSLELLDLWLKNIPNKSNPDIRMKRPLLCLQLCSGHPLKNSNTTLN